MEQAEHTYSKHADYTEVQEKYRANANHPQFELAVFEVPRDQMLIYTANPSIALAAQYLAADKILFCIHPQVLEEITDERYVKHTLSIGAPLDGFAVAPSSSSRTLYAKDFFNPKQPPLLVDLIGDSEPRQVVLENIMFPIIRHWVMCFRHFGFLLEPHGQNVLFEVDDRKAIKRIVHRDLSIGIDMRRRREIRLPDGNLNAYNRMESAEFHSITYDKFMGGHFFDRIVAACQEKYPTLQQEDFRQPCCDEFARIFPDHVNYLPKTIWYFSEDRDQFDKPLFHDTRKSPEWRP